MAGRKTSRPQIILLLFRALFIILALLHTPFLYSWTFYPQLYLFLLAHYFLAFFFFSLLRSLLLPISCQASPWRITKGIRNNQTTLPFPKKQTCIFCNRPFTLLADTIKKMGNYFQTWLSFSISHFTVQDYLSKHSTAQVCILWPGAIFHMGNREVILTLNIWSALF